ncbi:sigma factor-like helix-turn-helix DNA-binding protein, partial [Acinetobacter baumannii]
EAQHIVLEELQALDRMLDGLSPRTRAAWLLSRLDGHTHAEIAGLMSVSVPRVRQYLAKAAEHCYRLRFGHPELS